MENKRETYDRQTRGVSEVCVSQKANYGQKEENSQKRGGLVIKQILQVSKRGRAREEKGMKTARKSGPLSMLGILNYCMH